MSPRKQPYTVTTHPVTGDPYVDGNVLKALADYPGAVRATVEQPDSPEYTIRGWLPSTRRTEDPDAEAITGDLTEGVRLVLGTLLTRQEQS